MRYFDRNTWFWLFMAGVCFLPFLGILELFPVTESHLARIAEQMAAEGSYLRPLFNERFFTYNPPLFLWLQSLGMQLFAENSFAARFPNALLGIIVLPFLYVSGKFLIDRRFGFLWALSWFGSVLPFFLFRTGYLEPLYGFMIFCGLFFLIHFIWEKNSYRDLYFSKSTGTYLWLAGLGTGFAIMTGGINAYIIICITMAVFWVSTRFRPMISIPAFLKLTGMALLLPALWLSTDTLINGPEYSREFIRTQWNIFIGSGKQAFPGFHIVVLLAGCFPASLFAIRGLGRFPLLNYHIRDFQRWMIILLISILVMYGIAGSDLIQQSAIAYYPITFLSALSIWTILEKRVRYGVWLSILVFFVGMLLAFAAFLLPWTATHPGDLHDCFMQVDILQASLSGNFEWSIWHYIPAVWLALVSFLFLILVRRKFVFAIRMLFFGTAAWVILVLLLLMPSLTA